MLPTTPQIDFWKSEIARIDAERSDLEAKIYGAELDALLTTGYVRVVCTECAGKTQIEGEPCEPCAGDGWLLARLYEGLDLAPYDLTANEVRAK